MGIANFIHLREQYGFLSDYDDVYKDTNDMQVVGACDASL